MKTLARSAALAAAALLLVGCASTKKPAAEPAALHSPAETLEIVRSQVGTGVFASVTEVDEADGWIALGEATPGDFPVGSYVSILDEQSTVAGTTIGHAEVRVSEPGKVYAKFSKGAGRTARVGDVAVKF